MSFFGLSFLFGAEVFRLVSHDDPEGVAEMRSISSFIGLPLI